MPPEDPDVIEKALRRALTEDDLVNTAAQHNLRLAEERLDWQLLRQMTVKFYQAVAQHHENFKQGEADETTG